MTVQSQRPRLLIVEDDTSLAQMIVEFLRRQGFEVEVESRGDRAIAWILAHTPDLVVLDVGLPGVDGFEVCRAIRPRYGGLVLMLTARGDDHDEIHGLALGADDYLAKPVRPRVLLARINALLRRSHDSQEAAHLQIGELVIDATRREAHLGTLALELTTAEFDLLWLLARHAGEILSRDALYANLHGTDYGGFDRSIDQRISRLRRKLGDDPQQPQRIKSVRGVGYMLVANVALD